MAAYDKWLNETLNHMDTLLPLCRQLGLRVVLDLHTLPGGISHENNSQTGIFREARFQNHFIETWKKLARRYKNEKAIWAYDLANEPVEGDVADGLLDWHDLATTTARAIRAIDPQRPLIIEASPWGGAQALASSVPIALPRVIYSFHFYDPGHFTHQGVFENPLGPVYPGKVGDVMWDKDQMRRTLQPVVQWQKTHNVPIYVGEFSAIRWAPGAEQYLRDAISLFEEYGWDWSYHAFREWPGWSVEHGEKKDDESPAKTPTARQMLLRSWFAQNRRTPLSTQPGARR